MVYIYLNLIIILPLRHLTVEITRLFKMPTWAFLKGLQTTNKDDDITVLLPLVFAWCTLFCVCCMVHIRKC